MQAALGRIADRIRAAAGGEGLRLRGGGTKDFYGGPLAGEVLDLREYAGVVTYEPTELVITARCGTPLAELEAVLAARQQMIPFEPPHFGAGATLGGCVAAGLAGPRRAANGLYYGSVRDYVLGCSLMDGRGEALRFGGQVMKNVAGYDVSRLAAGSMGTLGVILEVSLKVLPLPVARATLRFAMDEPGAIARLNEWGGRPMPISASAWQAGELAVRLEGAQAAVDACCAKLGGTRVDEGEAARYWQGLREQADPFFAAPGALWRVSVPPTSAPLALDGRQLIEWGGALRWWKTDAVAGDVRASAKAVGGHATLFRGGDRASGVFTPLDPVLARLHRNVKAVFDPAGVFNRGRLYPEW
ncbi:MAG: glycolate oxidase subunit GlcE [Proteobacteria bacterium]|nr:glycolate oxidase subunit GlcE [Pseudomonadota bacterium]